MRGLLSGNDFYGGREGMGLPRSPGSSVRAQQIYSSFQPPTLFVRFYGSLVCALSLYTYKTIIQLIISIPRRTPLNAFLIFSQLETLVFM